MLSCMSKVNQWHIISQVSWNRSWSCHDCAYLILNFSPRESLSSKCPFSYTLLFKINQIFSIELRSRLSLGQAKVFMPSICIWHLVYWILWHGALSCWNINDSIVAFNDGNMSLVRRRQYFSLFSDSSTRLNNNCPVYSGCQNYNVR